MQQVMLITRSNFIDPLTLDGLVMELDADQGITLVGSDVDIWADQSGNGNHFTSKSAIQRPLYVTNSVNGKPVLSFGENKTMSTANPFIWPTEVVSIFIVYKQPNLTYTSEEYFFIKAGSGDGRQWRVQRQPNQQTILFTTFIAGTSQPQGSIVGVDGGGTSWAIRNWTASNLSNQSELRRNNTLIATGTNSTIYDLQSDVRLSNGGLTGFKGLLSEFIIYTYKLSTTNRDKVINYLNTKYSIF